MAAEQTEKPPELAKLERVVDHCQRRLERAEQRRKRAEDEEQASFSALKQATSALASWMAENPDPQGSLV